MKRILVCGGRDYDNMPHVSEVLDAKRKALGDFLLCQGGARGADTLARQWADERGLVSVTFNAPWIGQGKAAGINRNVAMLRIFRPHLVIAFPGGTGTRHMTSIAGGAGVTVERA